MPANAYYVIRENTQVGTRYVKSNPTVYIKGSRIEGLVSFHAIGHFEISIQCYLYQRAYQNNLELRITNVVIQDQCDVYLTREALFDYLEARTCQMSNSSPLEIGKPVKLQRACETLTACSASFVYNRGWESPQTQRNASHAYIYRFLHSGYIHEYILNQVRLDYVPSRYTHH